MAFRVTSWSKLPTTLSELCLATSLRCGQSFRWKCENDAWTCVLRGRIFELEQNDDYVRYRTIWPATEKDAPQASPSLPVRDIDDSGDVLKHYLNLEPNLAQLYEEWSANDANFRKKAPKFTGVRILQQDAWEALVGFICSSNNNIIRISQMVDKLCIHYGKFIATWNGKAYHDFPTPVSLTANNVESHLRELGFGYRAKYIAQTARMVARDREEGWLDSLRNPESPVYGSKASSAGKMAPEGREGYRQAHEALLDLQGVGPKVADCVCLMGLGWRESVPIDTHVWQIAQRDYKLGRGKHSSLTKATYDVVANHFRKIWGKEAGWAHSVLFTADLKVFAERLHAKVEVKEEDDVKTNITTVVREAFIKEDSIASETKHVLEIDETAVSNSERVKRRRRK